MKALDTPVLLALLHGDPSVRGLGPAKLHGVRRESLDRLRRSLTVLPYDAKAAERVALRSRRGDTRGLPPLVLGALAILEANACDEMLTADPGSIHGRWPFRISRLT
jgi:hypothetical protein